MFYLFYVGRYTLGVVQRRSCSTVLGVPGESGRTLGTDPELFIIDDG